MSDPKITGSISNEPAITGQVQPELVIKGTMEARFPASVTVLSPILLNRTGANFQFSLDMNAVIANLPPGGVASVFGRTGDVTAQTGDYTFAQISSTPTTLVGYGITDAQPLDSDLTAIAALATATYGRSLLTLADAAALAAEVDSFFLTPTEGNAAYQPLDSDLTAIAALATTTFGRSLLTLSAYPTFNQNTTGSAATLTTPRNIDGQAFNGSADITVIAPGTHAAASKTTPVDADELPLVDSAASNVLKRLTWANLKATIAAYLVSAGWIREALTANRTYYVRADGSDSNNGLANTSGGAFLTPQKAYNTIVGLDLAGFIATISVSAGTFTGGLECIAPVVGGKVVLTGAGATTIISTTNKSAIYVGSVVSLKINSVKIQTTTSGEGISALGAGATIEIGSGVEIAATAGAKIWAQSGGYVRGITNFTISGNSPSWMTGLGGLIELANCTVAVSGTPAWGTAGIVFNTLGSVSLFNVSFSGSATGKRYDGANNSILNSFGAGTLSTYFPGSTNGTTATGAQQG